MFAAVIALAALVISAVVGAATIRNFQLQARTQRAQAEQTARDALVAERVQEALERDRVDRLQKRLDEMQRRGGRDEPAP